MYTIPCLQILIIKDGITAPIAWIAFVMTKNIPNNALVDNKILENSTPYCKAFISYTNAQTVDKAPANAGLFYSIPSFFDIIKISGKAVFLYDDEKCR